MLNVHDVAQPLAALRVVSCHNSIFAWTSPRSFWQARELRVGTASMSVLPYAFIKPFLAFGMIAQKN
jgi:hypothetical protein